MNLSFWPQSSDYKAALIKHNSAFLPPIIRNGTIVSAAGRNEPFWLQGGLSYVSKLQDKKGKFWAIKLFKEENSQGSRIADLEKRYLGLASFFKSHPSPYFVDIQYFADGVHIDGENYPVVLIEWVDGKTLDAEIKDAAAKRDQARLNKIAHKLIEMHGHLTKSEQKIVHKDIHFENIIVRPDNSYVLVDYDDVWIKNALEIDDGGRGHRNFQHPLRNKSKYSGAHLDHFAFCVSIASVFIIINHMQTWQAAFTAQTIDDTILFEASDFEKPHESKIFQMLQKNGSDEVQRWLAFILNDLLDVRDLAFIPAPKDIFTRQAKYKDPNFKHETLPLYNPVTKKFVKKN